MLMYLIFAVIIDMQKLNNLIRPLFDLYFFLSREKLQYLQCSTIGTGFTEIDDECFAPS